MSTLADRTRELIDASHGGNVKAAAHDIGVLQQTLDRVVRGEVKNPRADFLKALARFYEVSVDWMLNGKGLAPGGDRLLRTAEWLRYKHLLQSLDLPDEVLRAWYALPTATIWGAGHFKWRAMEKEGGALAALDAHLGECAAWTSLISDLIEINGRENTRAQIIANADKARAGFRAPVESVEALDLARRAIEDEVELRERGVIKPDRAHRKPKSRGARGK